MFSVQSLQVVPGEMVFATWATVKVFRADVVEALKSEAVHVLVDSWPLPVKGGVIEQADQPRRWKKLPF